jgi:hypothetical protein
MERITTAETIEVVSTEPVAAPVARRKRRAAQAKARAKTAKRAAFKKPARKASAKKAAGKKPARKTAKKARR